MKVQDHKLKNRQKNNTKRNRLADQVIQKPTILPIRDELMLFDPLRVSVLLGERSAEESIEAECIVIVLLSLPGK